jgi:hypothetical protein
MIVLYISLYIIVGMFLLVLMTLSGKANWIKIPGFELKMIVGIIFVTCWIVVAPVMWYMRVKN